MASPKPLSPHPFDLKIIYCVGSTLKSTYNAGRVQALLSIDLLCLQDFAGSASDHLFWPLPIFPEFHYAFLL